MKYTLLELTQRILESMDSDEVDSIEDTVESLAVANIVKECYFDIIGKLDLPEADSMFQLTASGDSSKPCLMTLPSTVLDLHSVRYNDNTSADPNWYTVQFLPWQLYLDLQNGLDTDDTDVSSMTVSANSQNFTFKFKTDTHPTYYASFDDNTLLFDSYKSTVDSTLVGAKTMCFGTLLPTFTLSDSYTPDLDARQFQLLLQAAKAQAFVELKQVENPKAERKERSNEILAQRTKNAVDRRSGSQTYRRYGRKG